MPDQTQVLDAADFKAWLIENAPARGGAAAMLDMSRRMVNYYASGTDIPRYIARRSRGSGVNDRLNPITHLSLEAD